MGDPVKLTDSQVKKAGRTIRRVIRGEIAPQDPRVTQAIAVAQEFRRLHQKPLDKANMGLRSMVNTAGCEVEVSQRMKRWPTIIDKLMREPNLPLSKMQDIGGCRAILNNVDEVRRVEKRIKDNRRRSITNYSDYIATPRESGYRGVHVVVLYDERQIEIQLRTWVMHEWAITVERLASRMGAHLKGDGEHAVQQWLAAVSEAMALEESGSDVPYSLQRHIQQLRMSANPYLEGSA